LTYLNHYRTALSFLTIFRFGDQKDELIDFEKAHFGFPWVGLTIGLMMSTLSLLTSQLGYHLSSAILLITLSVISGGLHLDGLCDSFDGLLSHRNKEKTLEILKDPRLGMMGAAGLFGNLLLKFTALVELHDLNWALFSALLLAPFWGRWCLRLGMIRLPYAREEGLGAYFWSRETKGFYFVTIMGCLLSLLCWTWYTPFILCVSALLPAWLFLLADKKIDGGTGDVLGAGCELTETSVLVAVAMLLL
jgi:adenosylcobinamide-GDP ribazoletransferase